MPRRLIHSAGWLSLLVLNAAMAQPIGGETALTLPTPEGPKLEVPQIAPAEPSLMLDRVRPLQLPPQRQKPSLGLLPESESMQAPAAEGGSEESESEAAPRAPYLEHDR